MYRQSTLVPRSVISTEAKRALRVRGENGTGKTSLFRMAAGLSH
jgi:ABC-type transport system involved in cytochrome c biogenesis ATPase subunit